MVTPGYPDADVGRDKCTVRCEARRRDFFPPPRRAAGLSGCRPAGSVRRRPALALPAVRFSRPVTVRVHCSGCAGGLVFTPPPIGDGQRDRLGGFNQRRIGPFTYCPGAMKVSGPGYVTRSNFTVKQQCASLLRNLNVSLLSTPYVDKRGLGGAVG